MDNDELIGQRVKTARPIVDLEYYRATGRIRHRHFVGTVIAVRYQHDPVVELDSGGISNYLPEWWIRLEDERPPIQEELFSHE